MNVIITTVMVLASGGLMIGQALDIDIGGDRQFTPTTMEVKSGDTLKITASGYLQYPTVPQRQVPPDGLPRGWADMVKTYPVIDGQKGALIGRIGDRETSRAFLIGSSVERKIGVDGVLFLGANILSADKLDGVFHVHIERTAGTAIDRDAIRRRIPRLSQAQLDSVAPRVQDKVGNAGDRVNFLVIASEDQIKLALQQAGWTKVDRNKKEAVVDGLFNSLSKQAYVAMPMSELYLFGRIQDYGFAQGDPLKVVEQRHHFRIWKAPFTVGGRTVWAGAGTHDIGFDRDRRAGGIVTHKIDPDTDKERDYIAASLTESGTVALTEFMTATSTITDAKTATGEEFKSDGKTVIIYFTPESQ